MSEDRSNEEKSSLFTFEHQESYQKIQFKFFDAVESMDHNNIIVSFFSHLFGVSSLGLYYCLILLEISIKKETYLISRDCWRKGSD